MSNEIDPDERIFNAARIEKVEAKRFEGVAYVRCPFCESLNRMLDTYRGLHVCGDCHVPFDVI